MMRKLLLMFLLAGVVVCPGPMQAALPPWLEYILVYDGYVERHMSPTGAAAFTADTLFVINNTDPTDLMNVWVEVFEKHGQLVWEGRVWDGGQPVLQIVPNGYGWFTLGMILNIVNINTTDPFGNQGGEKFLVRISAAHLLSGFNLVPTVEVKQVLYQTEIDLPEFAIWQPMLIKSWSEAALGGNRRTTGVIWPP